MYMKVDKPGACTTSISRIRHHVSCLVPESCPEWIAGRDGSSTTVRVAGAVPGCIASWMCQDAILRISAHVNKVVRNRPMAAADARSRTETYIWRLLGYGTFF
jgi:hypothetical protein